jgi:hypothetical protein
MNDVARCCDAGLSLAALARLGGAVGASRQRRARYTRHRVRRTLFHFVEAVSSALLLALVAAWIAYFDVERGFRRESENADLQTGRVDWFLINRGKLIWSMSLWTNSPVATGTFTRYRWHSVERTNRPRPLLAWEDDGTVHVLGFEFSRGSRGDNTWRYVAVPCWFLAGVLLILPALQVRWFLIRHRRRRHGRCPTCGYDLRTTPDRCPECGAGAANTTARAGG